jgi:hypothetical protein
VDGEDARKLADEFAGFGPTDLMNLPDRQAIARLGPRDTACNLETIFVPTPPRTYAEVYPEILARTRARYCTPRAEIRAQLAELRRQIPPRREKVDPFAKLAREQEEETPVVPTASEAEGVAEVASVPAVPAVAPAEPASEPNGAEEKIKAEGIKNQIIQAIGSWGYEYETEMPVNGGTGLVDLVLRLGSIRLACEISVTTSPEHELGNLRKCVRAGFDQIVHVCNDTRKRRKLEDLAAAEFPPAELRKFRYLTRVQLVHLLGNLALGEADRHKASEVPAVPPAADAKGERPTANERAQVESDAWAVIAANKARDRSRRQQ